MSHGCLVVEAALASGSLITARCAAEQGREVLAVPGSINSPLSRGCHHLLKQGAALVESAADVLAALGWAPAGGSVPAPALAAASSTCGLLAHLGFDPVDVDTLCLRSGLGPDIVAAKLLELELDGTVASLPGGLFQRLA